MIYFQIEETMNAGNHSPFLNTPTNRRSLGLRRPGSALKRICEALNKETCSPVTAAGHAMESSTSTPQTNRGVATVPYQKSATEPTRKSKSSVTNFHRMCFKENTSPRSALPATDNVDMSPVPSVDAGKLKSAITVSGRGYRLSLSRSKTRKMNRKRLEFMINENMKNSKDEATEKFISSSGNDEMQEIEENSYTNPNSLPAFSILGDEDIDSVNRDTLRRENNEFNGNPQNHSNSPLINNDKKKQIRKSSLEDLNSSIEENFLSTDIDPSVSNEDIIKRIECLRSRINSQRDHLRRVKELRSAIEIWRNGFSESLKDFRENFMPHCEYSEILQNLQIPSDLLQYIDS